MMIHICNNSRIPVTAQAGDVLRFDDADYQLYEDPQRGLRMRRCTKFMSFQHIIETADDRYHRRTFSAGDGGEVIEVEYFDSLRQVAPGADSGA